MKVVIDTSALIAVIINERERKTIIEITREAELIAPHSIYWEIGNAFSAMLKRGRITLEQCSEAIKIFRRIPLAFVEINFLDCMEICGNQQIYAYDAYLIQCALQHGAPLLTLDKALREAASHYGIVVLGEQP